MAKLIFLHNELIDPQLYQDKLRIPLEFICFGMTDGKMYKHFRNYGTFMIPMGRDVSWGNDKIYGGIFLIKEYDFYIDLLDSYHACSLTKLRRNHIKDIQHRVEVKVIPIYFETLNELSRLKYTEGNSIFADTYIGNINHPKIAQRFVTTKNYRIVDGINKEAYTKLFRRAKE